MKTKLMFAVLLIAIAASGAHAQIDQFAATFTVSGAAGYYAANPDADLHLELLTDHPGWEVGNTNAERFGARVYGFDFWGNLRFYRFVLRDYNLPPAEDVLYEIRGINIYRPQAGYKFKVLDADYNIRGGKSADEADAASWGEIKSLYR
jgi:hypothetical protein